MAIAPDAVSQGQGTTPLTIAHTCTGTNLVLVVGVGSDFTADDVTVTYAGVSMAKQVVHGAGGGNELACLFTLVAPTPGTNNIVVSRTTQRPSGVYGASFTGVHQTTPVSATGGSDHTLTVLDNTDTITVLAGGVAVDFWANYLTTRTSTPDGSQNRIGTAQNDGNDNYGASYLAAATTMGWTVSSTGDSCGHAIVALQAAAATVKSSTDSLMIGLTNLLNTAQVRSNQTDALGMPLTQAQSSKLSSSRSDSFLAGLSEASMIRRVSSASDSMRILLSETARLAATLASTDTLKVQFADVVNALMKVLNQLDSLAVPLTESRTLAVSSSRSDALAVHLTDLLNALIGTLSSTDSLRIGLTEQARLAVVLATRADSLAVRLSEVATVSLSSLFSLSSTDAVGVRLLNTVTALISLSQRTDALAVRLTEARSIAVTSSRSDTFGLTLAEASKIAAVLSATETCGVRLSELAATALSLARTDSVGVRLADLLNRIDLALRSADSLTTRLTDLRNTLAVSSSRPDSLTVQAADLLSLLRLVLSGQDSLGVMLTQAARIDAAWSRTDALRLLLTDNGHAARLLTATDLTGLTLSELSAIVNLILAQPTAEPPGSGVIRDRIPLTYSWRTKERPWNPFSRD